MEDAGHMFFDLSKTEGIKQSNGQIIALLEDTCQPNANWVKNLVKSHDQWLGAVGGPVEFAEGTLDSWAVYFMDFGMYQPPQTSGQTTHLTDINVSYKREMLAKIRGAWQERYNEVVVHGALQEQGYVLWMDPGLLVRQSRQSQGFRTLVRERYFWGRNFGRIRVKGMTGIKRLLLVFLGFLIPLVRFIKMITRLTGKNAEQFVLALPYLVVLTLSWSLGEWAGILTGSRH
jgi:hypothetical protein